jgi:thiamine-monophosphate kinase
MVDSVDLSEDELIAEIRTLFPGNGSDVRIGIGDDSAVLAPRTGELVVTADLLTEGVHFETSTISARDLGTKCVVVNVSDIAAMAASPRAALCAITLPEQTETSWVMELFHGIREACEAYGLSLVGGDLSRGASICIAVSMIGDAAPGGVVSRSGARPGDAIALTGTVGASAAGRRLLGEGRVLAESDRVLVRAHVHPIARVGEARVLARNGARAMIDVSDGVGLDLSRLCSASRVGARLRLADVPIAEGASLAEALGGGEDYELMAALPPEGFERAQRELLDAFGLRLSRVGDVTSGDALVGVGEDGTEEPLVPKGWDHFANR